MEAEGGLMALANLPPQVQVCPSLERGVVRLLLGNEDTRYGRNRQMTALLAALLPCELLVLETAGGRP